MISARIVKPFISLFFSVLVLSVVQGHAETPPESLTPRTSHRTVIEKAILIPPEVLSHWKAVKLAVIDKVRGTERIYIVPIGATFSSPSSPLTITVEAFLPAFIIEGTTITTSSNKLENPAAKVRVSENDTLIFQGWLFSNFPNSRAVAHPKYGLSLIGVVRNQK